MPQSIKRISKSLIAILAIVLVLIIAFIVYAFPRKLDHFSGGSPIDSISVFVTDCFPGDTPDMVNYKAELDADGTNQVIDLINSKSFSKKIVLYSSASTNTKAFSDYRINIHLSNGKVIEMMASSTGILQIIDCDGHSADYVIGMIGTSGVKTFVGDLDSIVRPYLA